MGYLFGRLLVAALSRSLDSIRRRLVQRHVARLGTEDAAGALTPMMHDAPTLDDMSGRRRRHQHPSGSRWLGAATNRPLADDAGPQLGWRAPARLLLAAVLLLVVVTDQATKWLTWRYFDGTVINAGGYILLGSARSWFAEPVPGAIANAVGGALIVVALAALVRRPRRTAVTVGSALVAAGWTSNVLDRVGLHDWSAPGSGRGVVDFIPSGGGSRCNLADLCIAVGLILLGLDMLRHRRARHRRTHRAISPSYADSRHRRLNDRNSYHPPGSQPPAITADGAP